MVHKPKHKVHSFRGLLGNGGEDEINLERSNVNLAYRIIKFEIMTNNPGTQDFESIVKVYRESQSSVDATVDFNESNLLGAATASGDATSNNYPTHTTIIFDNTLFSRNIFVTHSSILSPNPACNYYIEIEEVPVGAATLMQIKLGTARRLVGGSMGHA